MSIFIVNTLKEQRCMFIQKEREGKRAAALVEVLP